MFKFPRNQLKIPWLCVGDFNETLSDSEQFRGCETEEWKMAYFREVVDFCNFTDLGFAGLSCISMYDVGA